MRPLIVNLSRNYGGAEVRVLELAHGFAGSGVQYGLASLAGSALAGRARQEGINVHELSGARGNPYLAFRLAAVAREHGYDVLDCHNSQSQLWGELAGVLAGDVLRCITVHSVCRDEKPGLRGRLYQLVLSGATAGADVIIAVSDSVQSYLLHLGAAEKKIRMIPNAIRFSETSRTRTAGLRRELGWTDELVVTCVARLQPVKGLDHLIDAIAQLSVRHPELRCLIVGEGPMRSQLEAQILRLELQGRVHLAGFRKDVPQLLAESDLFCLPSLTEGLPFALLEACERRVPVIASNVGGMKDLMRSGVTALMVEPANPKELAEAISWMINNSERRRAMANRAHNLIKERFRLDAMVQQTLAAYSRAHVHTA